jgi:hypothetical protein
MPGFITLPILLALVVVTGYALVRHRRRRGREPWRLLRDLSPVSGRWLEDYHGAPNAYGHGEFGVTNALCERRREPVG